MNIWETKEGEDGIEALRNISEELCIANELKQQELRIREQELAIKEREVKALEEANNIKRTELLQEREALSMQHRAFDGLSSGIMMGSILEEEYYSSNFNDCDDGPEEDYDPDL